MIIGCVPVRNEQWFLARSLSALTALCDVVFVIDDGSTDATPEICRRFEKVRYMRSQDVGATGHGVVPVLRVALLRIARSIATDSVLICTDADEILTAASTGTAFRSVLGSLAPGESLALPWVWLWKDPQQYRTDGLWGDSWMPCVFRDDGVSDFDYTGVYHVDLHSNRIPRSALPPRRYRDVRLMHYQFVAWHRTMAKQAHRRMAEILSDPRRSVARVNEMYAATRSGPGVRLANMPNDWIQPWIDSGIDLRAIEDEEFSWFDVEILRWFAEFGAERFAELDIWDIDWERKRQLAIAHGVDGIPSRPITDPRSWSQRIHHAYVQRTLVAPFWRSPQVLIRPVRRILRRAGISRRRLGLAKVMSDLPW